MTKEFIEYALRKTMATGFIDVALLLANISQLKAIIEQEGFESSFKTILVLVVVVLSIILQVMVGCLLIYLVIKENGIKVAMSLGKILDKIDSKKSTDAEIDEETAFNEDFDDKAVVRRNVSDDTDGRSNGSTVSVDKEDHIFIGPVTVYETNNIVHVNTGSTTTTDGSNLHNRNKDKDSDMTGHGTDIHEQENQACDEDTAPSMKTVNDNFSYQNLIATCCIFIIMVLNAIISVMGLIS